MTPFNRRAPLPRAAYIHIPFCAHKCGYCDFASVAGADALATRYIAALEREIATRLVEPAPVDTIFVGGGTPTRLEPALLSQLLESLQRWLPLNPDGEFTVEANPGTLDPHKIAIMAAAGVNRVSLGAQSFQPQLLAALERDHDPADIPRAVALVKDSFPFWSLDLIFGVPGSNLDQWKHDLETALELGPAHLSCYGLVFEKGTPLWLARERGAVAPIAEEAELEMFDHTIDTLAHAGLAQYEISNFARPGHECRHNLVYWANEPYFGFGVGAARYVDGLRAVNTRELNAYLRRVESNADPTGPTERLEPEPRARETAVLMLRRTQTGLDRADFHARTGFHIDELAGPAIRDSVSRGLLHDNGQRLALTRSGLALADSVLSEFL